MTDIAIRVDHLSKLYHIGRAQQRHDTLRDAISDFRLRILDSFRRSSPQSAVRNPQSEDLWALRDVSFEVQRGEVVGIIGRNGAGKSTLLKILSRITEPTSGRAEIHGRVGSLLEVGTGFHPELTGRENIFLNGAILGMHRHEIQRRFDEIVAFAEIERFLDTPVKRYSSGMYVRLAFAVAAHLEPEILLVDEVLAVGDAAFQKKCLGKMGDVAKEGRTVLFVSHNMASIEYLCSKGVVITAGSIALHGSVDDAIVYYESQLLSNLVDDTGQRPSHIIYQNDLNRRSDGLEVVQIELLDESDQPKQLVRTWESVKFRIRYYSDQFVNFGSVVLKISTTHGVPVILLSTQPDSTLPVQIQPGHAYADCLIKMLPLSAGEYIVGAGLAVPNKEMLWHNESLARLTVHACDVYRSGLAPISSRSLLAVPHIWSLP